MPLEQAVAEQYREASARLLTMLDRGFVVSRWDSGAAEHQGDALIFSGLALASLSCLDGQLIEDALLAMVDELGGGLYRHPDLRDQVSLDGAIGVYRGAAFRIDHCPGSAAKWGVALQKHLDLNRLNPADNESWPLEFRYVPELALARANGTAPPNPDRMVELAGSLESWALGMQISHAACFRVNLGYQTLRTIEALGVDIPDFRKANFCAATRGMRLPTVEAWCDRATMADWISNFQYDIYSYRHERCEWEGSPDGKPGLHTPAVDLLEAIVGTYQM